MKKFLSVVIVIIIGLSFSTNTDATKKKVSLSFDKTTIKVIDKNTFEVSGKVDKKATITFNKQKVKLRTDKSGEFKQIVTLKEKIGKKVKVVAKRKKYKTTKVTLKVANNKTDKTTSSNISMPEDPRKELREQQKLGNGTYIVGQDIPEGEYVFAIGDMPLSNNDQKFSGSAYIYSDETMTYSGLIDSASIYMRKDTLTTDGWFTKAEFIPQEIHEYDATLFNLKAGQILRVDNMVFYPADLRIPTNPSKVIEGMYLVGRDIPGGSYKLKDYDNGVDEKLHSIQIIKSVAPGASASDNWIESYQDYSNKTYPEEITLEDGQYIYFSDLILSFKR